MPTSNKEKPWEIPVELTDEQITLIEELAELEGRSFQETLDDVINEVLAVHLVKLLDGGGK